MQSRGRLSKRIGTMPACDMLHFAAGAFSTLLLKQKEPRLRRLLSDILHRMETRIDGRYAQLNRNPESHSLPRCHDVRGRAWIKAGVNERLPAKPFTKSCFSGSTCLL